MVRQLDEMGIKLMVSIWPTVDKHSENFQEMQEKGYLIRVDRGIRTAMDFEGESVHFDATNPKARQFLWGKAKSNYYSKGIQAFWLDEAGAYLSVHSEAGNPGLTILERTGIHGV